MNLATHFSNFVVGLKWEGLSFILPNTERTENFTKFPYMEIWSAHAPGHSCAPD